MSSTTPDTTTEAPTAEATKTAETPRIAILRSEFGQSVDHFLKALQQDNGNLDLSLERFEGRLSTRLHDRIRFIHHLAEILDDSAPAVQAITKESNFQDLKELAANCGKSHFVQLFNSVLPDTQDYPSSSDTPTASNSSADALGSAAYRKLFAVEPSAVLGRMIRTKKLVVPDNSIHKGACAFFADRHDFNIRKESVFAFGDVKEQQPALFDFLCKLQRTQALVPTPEAVPVLMSRGFTSAAMVAATPIADFSAIVTPDISVEVANAIHSHAVNTQIRNEHAMTALLQTVRGTGLAIIDGKESVQKRLKAMNLVGGEVFKNANLETLFGDMDNDTCDDCESITSPAAYFVELLQFLRNNNLDPNSPNTGEQGIAGTVLEKLFARRPDLGKLQLTCSNTNTILPYLDLANEVMESFVVHLDEYIKDTHDPKQTNIDVYNVSDALSGELLAEPQNTNYPAYLILSKEVFPLNKLPYHQPLDEVRIFFKYLGASRYELLDTYSAVPPTRWLPKLVGEPLHADMQRRAATAEYLGLTLIDYIALTGEAYRSKKYEESEVGGQLSDQDYQRLIGLKNPWEYWGYKSEADLLSSDENTQIGLKFIKNQFLPRAGMKFSDLVDMLRTEFVNPYLSLHDSNPKKNKNPIIVRLDPALGDWHLDKVRLTHLDGTNLTSSEYMRIHRFVRLWWKMGWAIGELDQAISGLSVVASTFSKITPDLLSQLVSVVKLLEISGLEILKILTFWSNIGTQGDSSLYSRLFLTHNIISIDRVFEPDDNGNYLTGSVKISEHTTVILAAFNITKDELDLIVRKRELKDLLTIESVTIIYRHSLMAKILHVKPGVLFQVIEVFGDFFESATDTFEFLELWGRMEEAGLSFTQLNYTIMGTENALEPLGPSKLKVLATVKSILDGVWAIETAHPAVADEDKEVITEDILTIKLSALYDSRLIKQINEFLEGTFVWTSPAPPHLGIVLSGRLQYLDDQPLGEATIQMTGIPTDAEYKIALNQSDNPEWLNALIEVRRGPSDWLKFTLGFLEYSARDVLLSYKTTTMAKRFCFLESFLPYLKTQLIDRLIIAAMSEAVGLSNEMTEVLLPWILPTRVGIETATAVGIETATRARNRKTAQAGTKKITSLKALLDIDTGVQDDYVHGKDFKGHLAPNSKNTYIFVDNTPKKLQPIDNRQFTEVVEPMELKINGTSVPFTDSGIRSTDPIILHGNQPYPIEITNAPASALEWKTPHSSSSAIPTEDLLPQSIEEKLADSLTKLARLAIIINGLNLSTDEVTYVANSSTEFPGFEGGVLSFEGWTRLLSYFNLRTSLPKSTTQSLLGLFRWASGSEHSRSLSEEIADLIAVKEETVKKLLGYFGWDDYKFFRNEIALTKLKKACDLAAKVTTDVESLIAWARPVEDFWLVHEIAKQIGAFIRVKFSTAVWESTIKPLEDQLRRNQRDALISYLLVQPELIQWGVVDADSLFEFFLIDVQMGSCLETSRIKQAISTVQLFVQRCFLGLEEDHGVRNDALDRKRWDWMQKYTIWEANRRVFLYPENWIDPSLRDDKSPVFQEFEADISQKDLSPQSIQDAIKDYVSKVDRVSNLQALALYVDDATKDTHIFARTHGTPYFYYHRVYNEKSQQWSPWKKMDVEMPTFNFVGSHPYNGPFVVPVVWKGRLIIFIPQFVKKIIPSTTSKSFQQLGNESVTGSSKPTEYWEIQLGWSEYRNGKWTPKQLSSKPMNGTAGSTASDPIYYQFLPYGSMTDDSFYIVVFEGYDKYLGRFEFSRGQFQPIDQSARGDYYSRSMVYYHGDFFGWYFSACSMQDYARSRSMSSTSVQYTFSSLTSPQFQPLNGTTVPFYHQFSNELLAQAAISGTLDGLYSYLNSLPSDLRDHAFGLTGTSEGPDHKSYPNYHELNSPYSLYTWEVGLHAPMLLIDKLASSHQYEKALEIAHYVFDPRANGSDLQRVWKWYPFSVVLSKNVLETIFDNLQPNTADLASGQINSWRDNPFQPHAIARSRPVSYMKWMVMKYIEILIAAGDQLFRQNTLESVPLAIQYYVLAAHIYGPPGQKIPKRGKKDPATFNSLMDKLDAFGNAVVDFENVFPFSNQVLSSNAVNENVSAAAPGSMLGTATTRYFCVPDNAQIRALRATIDDRLYKIRHCQDINGNIRKLALFEPPLDPGALVQAASRGLSLANVLQDYNAPMPNYRFQYLIEKAFEMVQELKLLGGAFLSASEKKDSESYQLIRAGHETAINTMVLEMKKLNLQEANKALDTLRQARKSPVYRLQHFYKLIGEDLSKVPSEDSDFQEIIDQIEKPKTDGDLKLIGYEKQEIDKAFDAAALGLSRGVIETLAGVLLALPSVDANGMPLGVGVSVRFGPPNLGNAAMAVSRGVGAAADFIGSQASGAARKGAFLRQLQDRVLQANSIGYEIKNIDTQIKSQQTRITIAEKDILLQQKQIDLAAKTEEFLRTKYTNENLYSWQEKKLRSLYYQAYTLAHDLAEKAEKTYVFERGLTKSNFIQGYWDDNNNGIFSGENLYLGLKQLEAAYQENRGYDYEITKHISLRQVNPRALLELRELGKCEFAVPEVLFDMDFPGHYKRRIKSVSLSVPCVVGPYTSINCTMRLLEHKYRVNIPKNQNDYVQKVNEADTNFQSGIIPIDHIAVSNGQNDSGVFELNFRDERYIPFEGAGAISKWELELPSGFRQFDYRTITDAIVHVRYTSVFGGDSLKKIAIASIASYIKSIESLSQDQGLFALFDLKNEFANEWFRFQRNQPFVMSNLNTRLPFFTKSTPPSKIKAKDVYLLTSAKITADTLKMAAQSGGGGSEMDLTAGAPVAVLNCVCSTNGDYAFTDWTLTRKKENPEIDDLWMLVRYTLA